VPSSPLRVLIVSPSFGDFGGIQAFMLALARELRGHDDMEPRLCLKLVGDATPSQALTAALAEDDAVPAVFVRRASRELAREVRGADVVHLQTPSIDVVAAARALRRPLAMTIHNHRPPGEARVPVLRAAIRLAHRRWYNSDFVRDSWGISRSDPRAEKMPVVSDLPTAAVAPGERAGFLLISRWVPNKGIETLLRAYAAADLDRSRWPLTLVGDGPLRPHVEALVAELGLGDVRRPGFVSNEERKALIGRARWLVAPPNTREDLGLTPIEARHVGVPCIVTRDGGLPEAAGAQALVCEPGDVDGLRALLERAAAMDDGEYDRRSAATRAELLDYLRPMSLYAERYRELVRERARRP
jgi:glycosyltransferase involved in cell wall biosynthesis